MILQIPNRLSIHLCLQCSIHTGLSFLRQLSVLDELQQLIQAPETINNAGFQSLFTRVPMCFDSRGSVYLRGELLAEDRGHGRLERDTEIQLVETEKAAGGVEDAVVVEHGEHEAAGEGVSVYESDGWHWVC